MFSFDITFCHHPTCKNPRKCRRDPARLKNYPYPVSMADLNEFDENGVCKYFFPVETKVQKRGEDPDFDFLCDFMEYLKIKRRKQKAVKA